ncbi:MAG TPA: SIR2 family protein [Caulobacterales bacterium]|nr:SIR2 family protein [Caulobacterales bacterium]
MADLSKLDGPVQHILDGTATLFLGAGVSFLSKNKDGLPLPNGDELKLLLASELKMSAGGHALDKLANHFRKKRGPAPLYDLLQDRLTAVEVDPRFSEFLCADWRRIYTTNYDNAVEKACKQRKARPPYTPADSAAALPDGAVIHLNGYIEKLAPISIDADIRLTDRSYATSTLLQSPPWRNVFANDLRVSRSIVFVGYSLADLDIARILIDEQSLRRKLYFIVAPDADEIDTDALASYGEVFATGVEPLFTLLEAARKTYNPKNRPAGFTSILDLAQRTSARSSVPATLVDNQLIFGEPALAQIISGATVFDKVPYLVPRDDVTQAVSAIIEGHARDLVIAGGLASGKSFAALQAGQQLLQAGYKVYDVADGRRLQADLDKLRRSSDRICLVVDGYRQYIDEIKFYLTQRPTLHTIILTERSASHEIVWSSLSPQLADSSIEVVLDDLSDKEIDGFDALINFAGLYPENVAGRPAVSRAHYVAHDLDRSLYRLLLEIIKSKRVQAEIERLLSPLRHDPDTRDFFTTAFIISALGLPFWINDWQAFYKLKNAREMFRKHADEVGHFVVMDTASIRSRPGVTSLYMLREFIDDDTIAQCLADIYEVAVKNSDDSEFERVRYDLIRYNTVEPLFSDHRKLERIVDYYDEIRSIGDTRNNSDYWLQLGIACTIHRDFERAGEAFAQAYARERARARPNTKKIDNYFARYQIDKAADIGDAQEAFALAQAGVAALLKQIFQADNRHYPFKAGRALTSVASKHFEHWDAAQQKQFLGTCTSLRDKALAWKAHHKGDNVDVDILIKEVNVILKGAQTKLT